MSFLDRILHANQHDLSGFIPLHIESAHVGWIRHQHARMLQSWPDVFRIDRRGVRLTETLESASMRERSKALAQVCLQLHEDGVLNGWRDEPYVVSRRFNTPPLMTLERAAVPFFGVVGYGVHLNGYVTSSGGNDLSMWIGRRALDKPTAPGELDQIVAGGQPHGISLLDNLIKECAEEANIPAALALQAKPTGAISYVYETPLGLRPDVLFCYDLELPGTFEPINTDGEVDSFECWPIEQVIKTIHDTDRFKFNCALVAIDFLIRHGQIDPENHEYTALVRGLHGSNASPLPGRLS